MQGAQGREEKVQQSNGQGAQGTEQKAEQPFGQGVQGREQKAGQQTRQERGQGANTEIQAPTAVNIAATHSTTTVGFRSGL